MRLSTNDERRVSSALDQLEAIKDRFDGSMAQLKQAVALLARIEQEKEQFEDSNEYVDGRRVS